MSLPPTRRGFLEAGLGAGFLGLAAPSDAAVLRVLACRQDAPWKLPDDPDPAAQSKAENAFWCEILRDHDAHGGSDRITRRGGSARVTTGTVTRLGSRRAR